MRHILRLPLLLISLLGTIAQAEVDLGLLDEQGFAQWETESFVGETRYELTDFEGDRVLKAVSDGTASGLVLKQRIDLKETPVLNWRWLITRSLPSLDERKKAGDDFVARVYVVIDGGFFFWKTRSLAYVWSGSQETDQSWDNPFAPANVKMLSVKGKDAEKGRWYAEERNVYQDLISAFGDLGSDEANAEAYRYIDAVAVMTDTDNSQSSAEAYYGNLVFTED